MPSMPRMCSVWSNLSSEIVALYPKLWRQRWLAVEDLPTVSAADLRIE